MAGSAASDCPHAENHALVALHGSTRPIRPRWDATGRCRSAGSPARSPVDHPDGGMATGRTDIDRGTNVRW